MDQKKWGVANAIAHARGGSADSAMFVGGRTGTDSAMTGTRDVIPQRTNKKIYNGESTYCLFCLFGSSRQG